MIVAIEITQAILVNLLIFGLAIYKSTLRIEYHEMK